MASLLISELISENVEENTRDVSFTVVKDLNEITAAKVSVDTGNPQFGVMHHDVRLQFDPSEIPLLRMRIQSNRLVMKTANMIYQ